MIMIWPQCLTLSPAPSGDLRNAEKHHVRQDGFAWDAKIHCAAIYHLNVTLVLP